MSSDIGSALAKYWVKKKWMVTGTYRTYSSIVKDLEKKQNIHAIHCDLLSNESIEQACEQIRDIHPLWDVIVFAPGYLDPIGRFKDISFEEWEKGIEVNFTKQLKILHKLLPYRNLQTKLCETAVLFFAGGGTNNAVVDYSSYTISKIALIKMCELLDAEIPETRFVIVGPGLVKTKIHEPTLRLEKKDLGENHQKILQRLKTDQCTPMKKVVDCCDWVITTKCKEVRGRNFSAASDQWKNRKLEEELQKDFSMYKLRRHKNAWVDLN
jgi:NAD(P)-dependent dehydrogenase (short-subunit alcohol dehydrogenase family)